MHGEARRSHCDTRRTSGGSDGPFGQNDFASAPLTCETTDVDARRTESARPRIGIRFESAGLGKLGEARRHESSCARERARRFDEFWAVENLSIELSIQPMLAAPRCWSPSVRLAGPAIESVTTRVDEQFFSLWQFPNSPDAARPCEVASAGARRREPVQLVKVFDVGAGPQGPCP